ncbi:alpha/beta hydrolase family esterase [Ruegeria marina]|uniref:Polyhydroxybutyrate depolymerase n=1 Tax=Ruegeria marina TaxID=639004 RepID=A0A1G6L4B7_9RHOB|nr:PHB depolymerase family esterase [Ruegeria marina]SDC38140.1 polyhydroxybutyrate depolymerase [Ruegeria marina]
MIRSILAALAFVGSASVVSADCAGEPGPCRVEGGTYHIVLPRAERPPVLVFLHGHGGEGAGPISNQQLVAPLLARGWAVLAPDGDMLPGGSGKRSWNFFPGWEGRDEAAFLRAATEDAVARFGLDRERVVLGGFSAGAFMVNYLACAMSQAYSAYVPVSGGFWRPDPEACNGPVRLLHTHGWSDPVVPLEGRILGGGRFQQGDILAGLEIWRLANGCVDHKPDSFSVTGPFHRRLWASCDPGGVIEFALFPGGHMVPEGWADMMVDWYEALGDH